MYASTRETLRIACSLLVGVLFPICCHAWIHHYRSASDVVVRSLKDRQRLKHHHKQRFNFERHFPRSTLSHQLSVAATSDALSNTSEDEDDEDYEYVEYDILTEPEFMGSEWLVGTVMDGNSDKIVETWVRLATDKDGKNVAIWGDNSQGIWAFDVANQFLSFSKEQLWGKDIWAGVVDDYYYTQGTVRGWNFFSAAAVRGQWQARRLGVDPNEAGVAPWFEKEDDGDDDYSPDESASSIKATADDATEATSTSSSEDSKA